MHRFLHAILDEDGATAVEYAVLLALVLMAVFGAVASLGTEAGTLWGSINTKSQAAGLGN
jgi:pilus assembly protein Flp/PilA